MSPRPRTGTGLDITLLGRVTIRTAEGVKIRLVGRHVQALFTARRPVQPATATFEAEVNIDIGRREIWICAGAILLAACAHATRAKAPGPGAPAEPWRDLLPAPVSAERGAGAFPVAAGMVIVAPQGDAGIESRDNSPRCCGERPACCREFCRLLKERPRVASCCRSTRRPRPATRATISPSVRRKSRSRRRRRLACSTACRRSASCCRYWSVYEALNFGKPKPASVSAVHIVDRPRFAWRGAMLDVARHFFGVEDVKRYIDLLALYKFNRLHLHLADDQGWRIEIKSWPELPTRGGSTGSRRRRRRVLHAAAVRGSRRVRRRSIHHDRPRDRHARATPTPRCRRTPS